MKTKWILMFALALLTVLVLTTALTACAEPETPPSPRRSDTLAAIEFEDGFIEFGKMTAQDDSNDMDLSFGSHPLPTGGVTYDAVSGPGHTGRYTLRVLDSRAEAGNWEVKVHLGEFVGPESENVDPFVGRIQMTGAVPSSAGMDPTETLEIQGGSDEGVTSSVVTGDGTLKNGTYDTTWTTENISLTLTKDNALKITKPVAYEAAMIWSLVVDD